MKRSLVLAFFAVAALAMSTLAPPSFAVDKEVIQLQQSVALLQGMVRELQRNFDEKTAVMRTLVEQSADQVSKLSTDLTGLQQSIQSSVGNAGQKMDAV